MGMSQEEYSKWLQNYMQELYDHRKEVAERMKGEWSHLDMLSELYDAFEDAVQQGTPKMDGNGEKLMHTVDYGGKEYKVPVSWGPEDKFEAYLQHTKWFLGKQLEFARSFVKEKKTPIAHIMGDELADAMASDKDGYIPPGLDKEYKMEHFELLEMMARKQIESIDEFLAGRVPLEKVISHYHEIAREEGNLVKIEEPKTQVLVH